MNKVVQANGDALNSLADRGIRVRSFCCYLQLVISFSITKGLKNIIREIFSEYVMSEKYVTYNKYTASGIFG
jgi:hypothetical protein